MTDMKKLYLSAAAVAALMASCSSGEEYAAESQAQEKVSFGTYVDMQKRHWRKVPSPPATSCVSMRSFPRGA